MSVHSIYDLELCKAALAAKGSVTFREKRKGLVLESLAFPLCSRAGAAAGRMIPCVTSSAHQFLERASRTSVLTIFPSARPVTLGIRTPMTFPISLRDVAWTSRMASRTMACNSSEVRGLGR